MIFYFSATGNSKYVAARIAEATGDTAVSILDWSGGPVSVSAGGRLGIVTPDYCGGIPSVTAYFLKAARFELPADVELYLVVTYGNNSGASGHIADRYLKKNSGRDFDALYSVKMPDTWTPVFDLTDAKAVEAVNRAAEQEIEQIIASLHRHEKGDFMKDKLSNVMALIYPSFYKALSRTKNLTVEDSCVGCGLCAQKCPVQAIEMRAGKPVWVKKNCAMCLGCLHRCPQFAIQYGPNTKAHGQYRNPNVEL